MLKSELKIIEYLLKNKETESNITSIAKATGMDYKNAHAVIKQLQDKDVVLIEKFGKSSKIILTTAPNSIIFAVEYERQKYLLIDKNFQQIKEYFMRQMKTSFYIMLLFGSYARGKQTKDSDIDLLFVVPTESTEKVEKDILSIGRLLPLKLHIHVFSEKDFIAMRKSREITVGSEAIKSNIIIHGIEQYYLLIR
jgi:predicted nucleotidyltransferase/predicted transcriptional regulator